MVFETMDFFINALPRWIFLILYQEYQISRERIIEIGVRFRPYNAPHIEISPLISRANLLTAFYMKRTLVVKGLRHFEVCLKKNYIINVFTWNPFLANVSMLYTPPPPPKNRKWKASRVIKWEHWPEMVCGYLTNLLIRIASVKLP